MGLFARERGAASVWEAPSPVKEYREETRTFDDIEFKVTRRSLSFPEETRLVAKVTDPRTKRADILELLAHTVDMCVKDSNFGLTPKRVREDLPNYPNLAWFLANWLCEETIRHLSPENLEEIRKKPEP